MCANDFKMIMLKLPACADNFFSAHGWFYHPYNIFVLSGKLAHKSITT